MIALSAALMICGFMFIVRLRAAAIRGALTGSIALHGIGSDIGHDTSAALEEGTRASPSSEVRPAPLP
jgi:hypothetical protein